MNRFANAVQGTHKGIFVNVSSTQDEHGKLEVENIQIDENACNKIRALDDESYFDWIDSFCEVLDTTGQFNMEVFSIHLGIE